MPAWSRRAGARTRSVFLGNIGIPWPENLGPGGSIDLLAMLLVAVLATLVTIGIKESMRVNMVLVGVKLFVVLFVIIAGIGLHQPGQLQPVHPARATPAEPGRGVVPCSR